MFSNAAVPGCPSATGRGAGLPAKPGTWIRAGGQSAEAATRPRQRCRPRNRARQSGAANRLAGGQGARSLERFLTDAGRQRPRARRQGLASMAGTVSAGWSPCRRPGRCRYFQHQCKANGQGAEHHQQAVLVGSLTGRSPEGAVHDDRAALRIARKGRSRFIMGAAAMNTTGSGPPSHGVAVTETSCRQPAFGRRGVTRVGAALGTAGHNAHFPLRSRCRPGRRSLYDHFAVGGSHGHASMRDSVACRESGFEHRMAW